MIFLELEMCDKRENDGKRRGEMGRIEKKVESI